MSRVKTFDSTGLATSGRIYAGDLNAIQDQYADLTNLSQSLSVGALAIGEAGLQLVRYGTAEARISGSLRTDGIVRALGGLYAGAFTTAQRDAIIAGGAPTGLMVLNTTTGRLEINNGTDGARSWGKVGAVTAGEIPSSALDPTAQIVPVGSVLEWPWGSAQIPSWAQLCYGQAISRATFAVLAALASSAGYPHGVGDGTTTFNLPDMRGRVSAGKDDMGGVVQNRITAAISGVAGTLLGGTMGAEGIQLVTAQLPAHNHAGITGAQSADHTHTGTTGAQSADHTHSGTTGNDSPDHAHSGTTGDDTPDHVHGGTTDVEPQEHTHAFTTAGVNQAQGHQHYITLQRSAGYGLTAAGPGFAGNVAIVPGGGGTDVSYYDGATAPPDHSHSGGTGGRSSAHTHTFSSGGRSVFHRHPFTAGGASARHQHGFTSGGTSVGHNHPFTSGGVSAGHTHTVSSDGSDQQHRNLPPTIIVNKMMRVT